MTKKQMNMMEKIISKHINHAWEDGAREERQNVVAWLRREASAMHPAEPDRLMLSQSERSLLLVFAACIERGEHVKEVTNGTA
jgi:hypothetical protein